MVRTLHFSLPRVWIQFLVGELRSHKLCGMAKKRKPQNQCLSKQLICTEIPVPKRVYCVSACSIVADSLVTLWTVAHQAPLSLQFPRQEYCSGLPFPLPGDLPNLGIETASPLPTEQSGKSWSFNVAEI